MEIFKIKLNETQTLIAYYADSVGKAGPVGPGVLSEQSCVGFKVGPNSASKFVDCSPDAAMALLAMLGRQENPTP